MKDFGDIARGRRVDAEGHLTRERLTYVGEVVGVFPHDPKHVEVKISSGEVITIRRQS